MTRTLAVSACALLVSAASYAASISTTLTVTNATGALSGSSVTVTGPASLSGIGNGTFTASISLNPNAAGNMSGTFKITLSGSDSISGTLTVPSSILTGSPATGSATVTGGTGAYAGATGSFPSLTGSGSITATGFSVSLSGAGTITTGGGGGGPTTPTVTITDVLDAASYTSGIAQGSIFVVKGTGLSASGYTALQFPLPTTSNGVKITFTPTSGGSGTGAYLIYLYNQNGVNQLAAVLPSTLAPGTYNVTVTNGSAVSAPFQVSVVQRKPDLITQDSTGTGLAVVQNYISSSQLDIDRFTSGTVSGVAISPASPGQTLIAWGTGLGGGVPPGDNNAQQAYDFTKNGVNVQVLVGGVSITPFYAGSAPGLAGADQIDFTLPANVPIGCTVPFQISVNGTLSNQTFIAIAPDASSGACVAPGFTTSQLQQLDNGGTFTVGAFSLAQITANITGIGTAKIDSAGGSFTRFTGFQLAGALQAAGVSTGSCQVVHLTQGENPLGVTGNATGLDAGMVALSGPGGSGLTNQAMKEDPTSKVYSLTLGTEGLPVSIPGALNVTLVPGTYTLNGAGGADVGTFNASVTLGPPLTVSNFPSTINRSAGLTLNWTGGNPTDTVEIVGTAAPGNGANPNGSAFFCSTTAGTGSFTVPSSILMQLPATSAETGFLEVISTVTPTTGNGLFTAPLTAGGNIDMGVFSALSGTGGQAAYQ